MAILQTNPSEAENYVSDHMSYIGGFGLAVIMIYIGLHNWQHEKFDLAASFSQNELGIAGICYFECSFGI